VGDSAAAPATSVLASTLAPLIAKAGKSADFSLDVLDPLTGQHLLTRGPATPRTPASTEKLLTTAAALTALGPDTTLPTTVVTATPAATTSATPAATATATATGAATGAAAGSKAGGTASIVLVGGGDVLAGRGAGDPTAVAGRAGLGTLAEQTARALLARGQTRVRLSLDDTLFTGPTRAPGWAPTDVGDGFVAPIQPLEIDAGRLTSADYAHRSADPSMAAATVFERALERHGVEVGGSIHRAAAPSGATELAEVDSAPIADQVEYALTRSDNTVAEALGRLVAAKTHFPASFSGAGPAVLAQVRKLGVSVTGAKMADASGLSASDRVPPITLAGTLAKATAADQPQLRPILSGLPVADVSGTLAYRFDTRAQRAAAGVVRAKTGTLTGVNSLAGMLVDADGRMLVFAAMADKVTSTTSTLKALDDLAAALASCGCR
jgi:D-alanyl-D-alanine carboxypeptidase/D-alanyl-D-alanine-endopeptidase (penicillin-binding protein 4)